MGFRLFHKIFITYYPTIQRCFRVPPFGVATNADDAYNEAMKIGTN